MNKSQLKIKLYKWDAMRVQFHKLSRSTLTTLLDLSQFFS